VRSRQIIGVSYVSVSNLSLSFFYDATKNPFLYVQALATIVRRQRNEYSIKSFFLNVVERIHTCLSDSGTLVSHAVANNSPFLGYVPVDLSSATHNRCVVLSLQMQR